MRGVVFAALVWGACTSTTFAPAQALLDAAHASPVAERAQVRFRGTVDAEPLGWSGKAGGSLMIDGDRAIVAIQDPLGGTRATLGFGDGGVAVGLPSRRVHLTSVQAEEAIHLASGGRLDGSSLIAALRGRVPPTAVDVVGSTPIEGGYRVRCGESPGVVVEVDLDRVCRCPRRLRIRDSRGSTLLTAVYGEPKLLDDGVVPGRVRMEMPGLDLTAALDFQTWEAGDLPLTQPLQTPEGFTQRPLQPVLERWAQRALRDWTHRARPE